MLDLMLLKAQQEYQETMNGWKQIPHIMKWFAEEEVSCNDARSSLAAPAISTADLWWLCSRVNLNARSSRRLTLCSSNSTGTSATRRLLGKFYASRYEGRGPIGTASECAGPIVASRLVFQSLTLQS